MNRIETIAPELVNLFENASSYDKYRILSRVCVAAIVESKIKSDLVLSSLNKFNATGLLIAKVRKELESLRDMLDDEYFDYQDSGENELSLMRFRQARAVAALAYAGDKTKNNTELEAVYESIMAFEKPDSIIEMIKRDFK